MEQLIECACGLDVHKGDDRRVRTRARAEDGRAGLCVAGAPAGARTAAGSFVHAFPVTQILTHVDYLDEAIGTVSAEVEAHLAPFAETARRLEAIPGINQRGAEVVIAELGVDMAVFPTTRHLASWAGLCPGNHESAGKHKSGKTR